MPLDLDAEQQQRRQRQLVALREGPGFTQAEIAGEVGVDAATISRYERGVQNPEGVRLRNYAKALRVSLDTLKDILKGGEVEVNEIERSGYGDRLVPKQFSIYVSLEQTAVRRENYQPHIIDGLLQTQEYTRALIQAEQGLGKHVEPLVELRMSRQKALTREDSPLALWAALRFPDSVPACLLRCYL